jgi:antitoxin component of RelBE/YafQ-DinJ toxin-antitoxin module
MPNKTRQINVRVDSELEKKIKSIKEEMKQYSKVNLTRSQVIEMLIKKGIEKHTDEQFN